MSADLTITALTVRYGTATAVEKATLTAPAGRITAVVGPNGAGKSSLALGVYGAVAASGGIDLGGTDLSSLASIDRARAGLAIVPQGRQLFPKLTVRDNLQVMAEMLRLKKAAVDEALDRFPVLRERESRLAGVLSGGEQQMLVVSRALMGEPHCLVLDEMMTGLAPKIVSGLADAIREIADRGASVLIVDPAIGPLQRVIDRGYVLLRAQLSGAHEDVAALDEGYQRAMGIIQQEMGAE
ncbi:MULTISPECIES: ATP-binding cassette domain-containing protein [unclassified Microbacterium]|uniref:ATP-binding cassette domain-containing protein n=1 Tax=unclassified Microbacterium TaxID=2609290 RepID=UPI001604CBA1|nr:MULTISPECIES: ATP-binding cassette domain-containing protein [unclassified Microbacterium]QNA93667.1 ATP-binding cassette domain-containing protein [Microbacterium sp. Se63.02b]QYM63941.1 ATP-binding cassette domain-containing protein [Microbacterium sp. Se5.02b]